MIHFSARLFILLTVFALPIIAFSQDKPTYCDELPMSYEKGASRNRPSLPRFNSTPVKEYKVQVAILKHTHPQDFPFHPDLVARFRPCEQVWVIESRESFSDHAEADQLRRKLDGLGYRGCYLVEMLGYE